MKITAIERQKKRSDRVSVFIDEEFWTGMSENLFLEININRGDEIDQDQKEEIERKVIQDDALGYALMAMSKKQFSERKLKEKLIDRGYNDRVVLAVIEKCIDLDIIDDKSLAVAAAEYRKGNGQYRKKVAIKLKEMGIEDQLIEQTLDQVFLEDERDLAKIALEKSRWGDQKLDIKDQKKAIAFLQRNGFSYPSAKNAVSEFALSDNEEIAKNGVDKAVFDLEKKYSAKDAENPSFYPKASGFLFRRGYHIEVIQAAISEFREQFFSGQK